VTQSRKMMKRVVWYLMFLSVMSSVLCSGNLLESYNQRMHGKTEDKHRNSTHKKRVTKSVVNDIKIIQNMKKTTFESTDSFKKRRDQSIAELEVQSDFYVTHGTQEYAAGTVQMIHYDPDTQMMKVRLNWDNALVSLLHEVNLQKTASFSIERREAKKLFANNKQQFFHIRFFYRDNKIKISEILLHKQYILYEDLTRKRTVSSEDKTPINIYTKRDEKTMNDNSLLSTTTKKESHKQNEISAEVMKNYEDSGFNSNILIILSFLVMIGIFFKYTRSMHQKENIRDTNRHSSQNVPSEVAKEKTKPAKKKIEKKKTVKNQEEVIVKKSCSKELHNFVLKHSIALTYKTIQDLGKYSVEIRLNKKILAKHTGKNKNMAKLKAQCEALMKLRSLIKKKS